MSTVLKLEFAALTAAPKGVLIVLCDEGLKCGTAARKALEPAGDLLERAAAAERFKGKNGSALEIPVPAGLGVARLIVLGVGKVRDLKDEDLVKLGGVAMGKIPSAASAATIIADLPGGAMKPDQVAELALGIRLRAYAFDRYKTKRKDDEDAAKEVKVTVAVASPAGVEKAFAPR
ncbi:MAG TPA: M17 family peptidase N-terminal domain-containing protein, partial [Xanthobacteraceae bacterium]|nr:M17 family peptidase N-terminal domain-containing protein [Xanthobacteraceae bacterium]